MFSLKMLIFMLQDIFHNENLNTKGKKCAYSIQVIHFKKSSEVMCIFSY